MPTAPRHIVPGTTWLITRRTTQRTFFLKPSPVVNAILEYLLAALAEKYSLLLHGFCFLSDHYLCAAAHK